MQIAFHLGAHCTDVDRLLKAMIVNQRALASAGIAVPSPKRYRPLLREALAKLRGAKATPEMAEAIRKHILGDAEAETLLLASDSFICAPRFVLGQKRIYPMIADRVYALRGLFPDQEVRFSIALRNPATLIPALYKSIEADLSFERLIGPVELKSLRWSQTLKAIHQAVPDAKISVWANEDAPLVWPDVLKAVTGHADGVRMTGLEEVLDGLLKPGGMDRLKAYLVDKPDLPQDARRKVMSVFLEKFGDPKVLIERFDLPGWSEAVVWELTRAYEMDLERIARMPNVTLLRP